MAAWQFSKYGKVPLYFVCLDGETLDVLGESHYFNITNGPTSTTQPATKAPTLTSTLAATSATTSTLNASNTDTVVDGTPPYSTNAATSIASSTATPQSTQSLPKKAIAGISVGATIGSIFLLVVLGFLARKYRIWNNGIFHNTFREDQQTANMAELQADQSVQPTELPVNQEIKNARVWKHPRGSGGLYEVP
ncbi:hypothetical protein ACHAO4_002400 [Trichoderma viride]